MDCFCEAQYLYIEASSVNHTDLPGAVFCNDLSKNVTLFLSYVSDFGKLAFHKAKDINIYQIF